jgi:tRNA nucleotidyltransferase (CCA-adding enzyme)
MDLLARLRAQPGGERLLAAASPTTFLVGGAVRDLLLGRSPRELDVVVEGGGACALARALGAPTEHPRFGTAIVELDGARIDVASARRERYPAPGALPQVEPATLAEDLLRRDFTVNAIAVTIGGGRLGEVHAAPGALKDLRAGRLRVLHDASFIDDPTRLLRLARYAARLEFQIEAHTAELASRALAAGALETISGARIGAELRLALGEPDPIPSLEVMRDLGLLEAIDSRLRLDRPLLGRALSLLPSDGRADLLTLAAMMLSLATTRPLPVPSRKGAGRRPAAGPGQGEIAGLLDRLEFAAGDRDRIAAAAAAVPRLVEAMPSVERPSQLRAALAGTPPEGIALAGGVSEGVAGAARRWLTELRHIRLAITGEDLLAAGVPEGPEIGHRLDVVLRRRLDGEVGESREEELAAALEATI